MSAKIVVATDFSDCARAALARAVAMAGPAGAEVVVVHAIDTRPLHRGLEPYGDVARTAVLDVTGAARIDLERAAAQADPERRSIRRLEVVEGEPATAIVHFARVEKAELLVLGTHGRTGLARLFAGSVAEEVVRRAPCDTLVVHAVPIQPAA